MGWFGHSGRKNMAIVTSNRLQKQSKKQAIIAAAAHRVGGRLFARVILAGAGLAAVNTTFSHAATTINWATPSLVTSSTVSSTAGSADITVPSGTWAVGDVIRFTGTSTPTNPFGASPAATR